MKNAFYFIIKELFVLKIFRFLSWPFWSRIGKLVAENAVPDHFEHFSVSKVWNLTQFFSLSVQVDDYQNMLKLRCWSLTFNSDKALELVSLPCFLHNLLIKVFLTRYVLLTDQILLSDCIYFLRYWEIFVLHFIS